MHIPYKHYIFPKPIHVNNFGFQTFSNVLLREEKQMVNVEIAVKM